MRSGVGIYEGSWNVEQLRCEPQKSNNSRGIGDLWWVIISSPLNNRDEVVDEGFWKKNWGVLFSK